MKKKKKMRARKTRKAGRHHVDVVNRLPIHIRADGEVDNELVNVRKSATEQVVWFSDAGEFTIRFGRSPFAKDTFVVPAGKSTSSGPIRADATVDTYPYFIDSVALAMSADPGLNIKP